MSKQAALWVTSAILAMLAGCSQQEAGPTEEETNQLIQPVARVEMAGAAAGGGATLLTGEEVVTKFCGACHNSGVLNAPKTGDAAAWAPRISTGLDAMLKVVITGKGQMPARGGGADLQDIELARAIVFMANKSGGNLKEPAAPAPAAAASAPAAAAAK